MKTIGLQKSIKFNIIHTYQVHSTHQAFSWILGMPPRIVLYRGKREKLPYAGYHKHFGLDDESALGGKKK